MKASDLFGVIVRTIGLLAVINGAWYLVFGFLDGAGAIAETTPGESKTYFASGVPFVVGGCFLIRGADLLVRFAYPQPPTDSDNVADPMA